MRGDERTLPTVAVVCVGVVCAVWAVFIVFDPRAGEAEPIKEADRAERVLEGVDEAVDVVDVEIEDRDRDKAPGPRDKESSGGLVGDGVSVRRGDDDGLLDGDKSGLKVTQ